MYTNFKGKEFISRRISACPAEVQGKKSVKGRAVLVCVREEEGRVIFPMVPSKEGSGPGEAV